MHYASSHGSAVQQFMVLLAVAPNGIMYVKPYVRKGLLGRMLVELLETRVMVKQAMKSVKEDKVTITTV